MGGITLHPKHGVNPSLDVCFWCGEAMGVALLGRNKGQKAPHSVVTGYTPCDKCREQMAQGITLVEAGPASRQPQRPEIQPGVVPTGRWLVIKEVAVSRVFKGEAVEALLKSRKGFVEGPMFEMFLPDDQKAEEKP